MKKQNLCPSFCVVFFILNADFSLHIHLLKMGNHQRGLNGLNGAFVQCKLIQQPQRDAGKHLVVGHHVILL